MKKKKATIKFVKKANQFCRTSFNEKGEQIQEWFKEKPV